MIIQNLMGGLGNQMFQYAFIRAMSHRYGLPFGYYFENPPGVFSKRSFELSIFNIQGRLISETEYTNLLRGDGLVEKITNLITRFGFDRPYRPIREKSFPYDPEVLKSVDNCTYSGYWQTERYFKDCEAEIRSDFRFKKRLAGKNYEIARLLLRDNYVGLHVRRGDYVKDKATNSFHGICTKEYYEKAISYIGNRGKDIKYIVFSDDIAWCRKNIKLSGKPIFADWNKGNNSYADMRLMSLCKHNVIANSSFSWWGAWLNGNQKKIIVAPKTWFNSKDVDTRDIVPSSWVRI